jgi:hypothetical protein
MDVVGHLANLPVWCNERHHARYERLARRKFVIAAAYVHFAARVRDDLVEAADKVTQIGVSA